MSNEVYRAMTDQPAEPEKYRRALDKLGRKA